MFVGIQKAPVEIDLASLTFEEKILIGTNALVREVDFPRAVELIARRAGDWQLIAPRVVPLEDYIEEGLRPMSEGAPRAIKTLVDPRASAARPIAGSATASSRRAARTRRSSPSSTRPASSSRRTRAGTGTSRSRAR